MKTQLKEHGLVELGIASRDTEGLTVAQEPEASGYRIKGMPGG